MNGVSLNATATAGSVVTEIACVPMPRIWMLYPAKLVFVNVMFGTCLIRSGPPVVCVAVNCSCDSAVIEIGIFCTSPPILEDVTVTVSSDALDATGAVAAATSTLSIRGIDACSLRTIAIESPTFFTAKPVPDRIFIKAASADISPDAPRLRAPSSSCAEIATGTPDCAEYASSAEAREPPGILNVSADAAPGNDNDAANSTANFAFIFILGPPYISAMQASATKPDRRSDARCAGRISRARRRQSLPAGWLETSR